MFTNAVAAVTVVFNALATEIGSLHRAEVLSALGQINQILASDEGVLRSP